jgi:hypothetical protein
VASLRKNRVSSTIDFESEGLMETDLQTLWSALQGCWAGLECGRVRSMLDGPLPQDLRQRHAQALEALVDAAELTRDAAEGVGAAFEQILAHDERLMSMCYIAFPVEYVPRQDLMGQVAALEEMAGKSDLDPAVVAQVRDALGRDIAWLAQFVASEEPGIVSDIEVGTTSAEAARILVDLLLGRS